MDSSNFVCCICSNIPDTVVESSCCHSLYCWECVVQKAGTPCPACKKPLNPEGCNENIALQKLIEKIPIKCKFEKCNVTVPLSALRAHTSECGYAPTMCPNSDLCGLLQKRDLSDHEVVCEYRKVSCHVCEEVLPLNRLQRHLDEDCPNLLIVCPNNCDSLPIPRSEMTHHLVEHCPSSYVSCPFAIHGCKDYFLRSQLDTHLRDDVGKHLLLMTSMLEAQQREITLLREQIRVAPAPLKANVDVNMDQLMAEYRPFLDLLCASFSLPDFFFWVALFFIGMIFFPFPIRLIIAFLISAKGWDTVVKPAKRQLSSRNSRRVVTTYCVCCFLLFWFYV